MRKKFFHRLLDRSKNITEEGWKQERRLITMAGRSALERISMVAFRKSR
jgi:hypothetical protein